MFLFPVNTGAIGGQYESAAMLKGQDITVIGAGIGGLAAALALARRGARVRILEQADEIREVGAGLQISPNGMVVLEALGLGDTARALAVQSQGIWLHDGLSGKPVIGFDLEKYAQEQPFLLFHRADLQRMLADAARDAGVEIQTAQRVTGITPGETSTEIEFADGRRESVGFLVGADGLHSVLRPVLNPPDAPFFTGQVAWRAVIPANGTEKPGARVDMGPGRHLVTYPLRGGTLLNLVAVEERAEWASEGWFHRDSPENLRAGFAGFCPEVRQVLDRVTDVFIWGLHRHPVAMEWHRGRTALLGDAAHPTLPFMAQGAVLALEDAWVLAASLADLGLNDGAALYQARRRPRATDIVEAANKNARAYHLSNPVLRGLGHGVLRLGNRFAPDKMFGRYDWIYRHDVTRD